MREPVWSRDTWDHRGKHTALMARKYTALGLGQAVKKPVACCCARTRVLGQKVLDCARTRVLGQKPFVRGAKTSIKLHDLLVNRLCGSLSVVGGLMKRDTTTPPPDRYSCPSTFVQQSHYLLIFVHLCSPRR
jgi:hypothetical protein